MNVKELKETEQAKVNEPTHDKRAIGVVLIIIGLIALGGQFLAQFNLSYLILPGLGIGFLAWGIMARQIGFLIPGGILSGIGLGVIMTNTVNPESELGGAVFLLSFAAGWGLITLLSAIFTNETHWWPLIPGGIMAAIGGAILIGDAGTAVLAVVGRIWPIFLIAAGVYIIWRQRQAA